MPLLQVKDFPAETYERLRECAAREHRSISQQTVHIVEMYVEGIEHLASTRTPSTISTPKPARSRFSYARDPHDTTDYAEKRRRSFERIDRLPRIPVSDECPSAAELVAIGREEDAE